MAQLKAVKAAAVEQCDAIDGLRDGLIDDPRLCTFDPAGLVRSGVLTAAQAAAVRKVYAGPRNPRTGEQLYPGLERGSEYDAITDDGTAQLLGSWLTLEPSNPAVPFLGNLFYSQMVFSDLSWDYRTLDYDHDVAFRRQEDGGVVNSTNPDFSDFKSLGGKLILYQGCGRPSLVNPRNTINYYKAVVAKLHNGHKGLQRKGAGTRGDRRVPPAVRRRPASTIARWDRPCSTRSPQSSAGSSKAGLQSGSSQAAVSYRPRTRPLCPYPQVARYTGHGSSDDAATSFCANPQRADDD